MISSFSTALSGLSATATAIDVVGNNLANLNTTGFKASVVSFHDLVTESLGAQTQVGFGVAPPVTLRQFSQGTIQSTGGALDAAIQGDGFFIVHGPFGQTQYTRGGNFKVDASGNLMTVTDDHLQGWTSPDGVLNTNLPPGDIVLPVGSLKPPVTTKNFSVDLNLNASGTTGTFSSSIEIFDSLGNSHIVSIDFTKSTTANQWDYSLTFPDADVTSPITPVTGTLTFATDGKLTSPSITDPAPVIPITGLLDGASDMNVTWNLFNGTAPRITQFSQPSAVSALAQDGSASANLVHINLADGGKIVAQYSNGQQLVVGQLALATIRNPQSLIAVGNSNYQLSALSAIPAVGLPGTGGRGTVLGGAVEASNVDIAREFTNLIIFQRAYQASARLVTTVDEISQETINLKR